MSLNSSGLTPTGASTAVSAASGVWLRRVLLAVAAFETLNGLIGLAVFGPDLNNESPLASFGAIRLFIHPFFAIAALVLAAVGVKPEEFSDTLASCEFFDGTL